MVNYKNELAEIFKLLISNNPYSYRDIDLSTLERDWSYFFTKNKIPAERLLDIYYEVVEYKAETSNTFGIITNVDMLHGWNRLQAKAEGLQAKKCEICGNNFSQPAGLIISFEQARKKNFLVKCKNKHRS